MLKPGIYEKVIDIETARELENFSDKQKATAPLDEAEAPAVLSQMVAKAVRQKLEEIGESNSEQQLELVNTILCTLNVPEQQIEAPASQLTAILHSQDPRLINGCARDLPHPETSLTMSSLFTGSNHEPAMFSELKKEIASADRIDMLVSFIRFTGLRLILQELTEFTHRGGHLRVITTSYMGATEVKAVEELFKLPNTEVRISYDTQIISCLVLEKHIRNSDCAAKQITVSSSN